MHRPWEKRQVLPADELGSGLRKQIESERPPNLWMTWLVAAIVVTIAVAVFFLAVSW